MSKGGRPTKYKEEYTDQAYKLCLLGATDKEMADFFERDRSFDEFIVLWLKIKREDRFGHIAARKKKRSINRAKYMENPNNRIVNSIRARMWASIKGKSGGKLFSRLGYSKQELCKHLEKLFQKGMNWSNYGEWHIDHRKPCSLFNQADDEQFRLCWSLSNLQPLWKEDNIRKNNKYGGR